MSGTTVDARWYLHAISAIAAQSVKSTRWFVELTHSARITRRGHAKERVAMLCQQTIKDWPKLSERPDRHDGSQPPPTRQDANNFNPGKVTFAPATISCARVHLFGHLFACVRRGALQNFRIVVIKPFNSMIPIERLNASAHPFAKIAIAIGVNFDFAGSGHGQPFTSLRLADTILGTL